MFITLNTSEQLQDRLLPKGKCKEPAAGEEVLSPSKCGPSDSEQMGVGGGKTSTAKSRTRFVSGAMPGHRLLPATHSFFWESRGAAALGKPDLISKHEGKRITQPSQIWNHLEWGVSGTSSSLSSLFLGLGLWVPERAKECVLPAGAAVSPPSLCGLGRLWSGQEQSHAADSCGGPRTQAPTTWLPF